MIIVLIIVSHIMIIYMSCLIITATTTTTTSIASIATSVVQVEPALEAARNAVKGVDKRSLDERTNRTKTART